MNRAILFMSVFMVSHGCTKTPSTISDGRLAEGVYATSSEISGFSGTILELKAGKYRYWFYSDVSGGERIKYPISGEYRFEDGKVVLLTEKGHDYFHTWYVDVVNNIPVLWRKDAFDAWKSEGKIYDYGVLVWTHNEIPDVPHHELERRSIRTIYSPEKLKEVKEWKDPFVHGAQ